MGLSFPVLRCPNLATWGPGATLQGCDVVQSGIDFDHLHLGLENQTS